MKIRFFLMFASFIVSGAFALSCMKEVETPSVEAGQFEAVFDATPSKAVLVPGTSSSQVEWNAGDKVSVLSGSVSYLYKAAADGPKSVLVPESQTVTGGVRFMPFIRMTADLLLPMAG